MNSLWYISPTKQRDMVLDNGITVGATVCDTSQAAVWSACQKATTERLDMDIWQVLPHDGISPTDYFGYYTMNTDVDLVYIGLSHTVHVDTADDDFLRYSDPEWATESLPEPINEGILDNG